MLLVHPLGLMRRVLAKDDCRMEVSLVSNKAVNQAYLYEPLAILVVSALTVYDAACPPFIPLSSAIEP